MADTTEKVPVHDLSSEQARTAFNAEGWDQSGDNQGAAMVLDKRDSTSARVAALMESGITKEDAEKQAVQELDQKLEGKTADVETYIRLFSKEVLTPEEGATANRYLKSQSGHFSTRAILYSDRAGRGEFLLRYVTSNLSIKEVRIKPKDIAAAREALGEDLNKTGANVTPAYRWLKARLQELEFHFDKPGAGIEDRPTPYDVNVNNAIVKKRQTEQDQAVEDKRKRFDL